MELNLKQYSLAPQEVKSRRLSSRYRYRYIVPRPQMAGGNRELLEYLIE